MSIAHVHVCISNIPDVYNMFKLMLHILTLFMVHIQIYICSLYMYLNATHIIVHSIFINHIPVIISDDAFMQHMCSDHIHY